MRGYTQPPVQVGETWGARDRPRTPGVPLRPVELLQLGPDGSKMVRVRRLDDEFHGLDEWIKQTWLVVPWEEAEAQLEDERARLKLWRHATATMEAEDEEAVSHLFSHLEVHPRLHLYRGVTEIQDFEFALDYLGLDFDALLKFDGSRIDRRGVYIGPWEVGLGVARGMARRHAEKVDQLLRDEMSAERDAVRTGWVRRVGRVKGDWCDPEIVIAHLPEYERLHATIRTWAGLDPNEAQDRFDAVSALTAELDRLRGVLADAADRMEFRLGDTRAANRLRREAMVGPQRPQRR